ncbi:MAG: hypothetical protein KGI84_07560 [Elusimicrobia bacterium]|nr:hypothetical protein [Elusimicrobiota bacterium]
MDFLLKAVTPRKVALFIALLAALSLGRRYGHYLKAWYLARRYPPVGAAPLSGKDISAQIQNEESRRVVLRYRQVCALLAAAGKRGAKVDGLKAEADAALSLNTPAYRREALRILSRVQFSIPRKQ